MITFASIHLVILYHDLFFVARLAFTFKFNLLVSNTSDGYDNEDSLLINATFVFFTQDNSYRGNIGKYN